MKNFISFLLICICIVGCKKEEIPIRQSPIQFFDEITMVKNILPASYIIVFSDLDGNTIGCQGFSNNDDEIIIPDSINQYEGYHITKITFGVAGAVGINYSLSTFTNIKTNKIKIKDYTPYDLPLKSIKVGLENNSASFVEFFAVQGRDIQPPSINYHDFDSNVETYTYSDYYYLTVKLQNENSVRFKKIFFPNNNEEIIVDVSSMTKSDSRTVIDFPEKYTEVTTLGIENCEELAFIPIGFYNDDKNEFRLSNTDSLSFEKYITNLEYEELDSVTFKKDTYLKIIKGELPTPFIPKKLDIYIPHPEIDQFQMIIPNPNLIARTGWESLSESYLWYIYGDYYGTFKAPKNFQNCFPGLDLPQISDAQLKSVVVYESSDYSNYKEFLNHNFENKIPFYLENNCDATEDEYLIKQTFQY